MFQVKFVVVFIGKYESSGELRIILQNVFSPLFPLSFSPLFSPFCYSKRGAFLFKKKNLFLGGVSTPNK